MDVWKSLSRPVWRVPKGCQKNKSKDPECRESSLLVSDERMEVGHLFSVSDRLTYLNPVHGRGLGKSHRLSYGVSLTKSPLKEGVRT